MSISCRRAGVDGPLCVTARAPPASPRGCADVCAKLTPERQVVWMTGACSQERTRTPQHARRASPRPRARRGHGGQEATRRSFQSHPDAPRPPGRGFTQASVAPSGHTYAHGWTARSVSEREARIAHT